MIWHRTLKGRTMICPKLTQVMRVAAGLIVSTRCDSHCVNYFTAWRNVGPPNNWEVGRSLFLFNSWGNWRGNLTSSKPHSGWMVGLAGTHMDNCYSARDPGPGIRIGNTGGRELSREQSKHWFCSVAHCGSENLKLVLHFSNEFTLCMQPPTPRPLAILGMHWRGPQLRLQGVCNLAREQRFQCVNLIYPYGDQRLIYTLFFPTELKTWSN